VSTSHIPSQARTANSHDEVMFLTSTSGHAEIILKWTLFAWFFEKKTIWFFSTWSSGLNSAFVLKLKSPSARDRACDWFEFYSKRPEQNWMYNYKVSVDSIDFDEATSRDDPPCFFLIRWFVINTECLSDPINAYNTSRVTDVADKKLPQKI